MAKVRSYSLRRASRARGVVALFIVLGVYWVLNTAVEPADNGISDDPPVDPDPQPDPDPEPETVDVILKSLFGPPGGSVPFLVKP